jgi:3-deoxy-manno-octulosonate cytidylyltransferase (CMP-KDO synthetase)
MSIVGMIPARYRSTRFEGKALADICGRPMVQHVYERAGRAKLLDEVLVATDDGRIAEAVRAFGGLVEMTSSEHRSGTDRLAEVAQRRACEVVVNIQGDEPLIDPDAIDAAVQPLLNDPRIEMSTLMTPIRDREEYENPSVVQVVVDRQGFALYFSRAPIPYLRIDGGAPDADGHFRHPVTRVSPYRHIGLYVYRRETLLWLAGLPRSPLEQTEGLEQLRALENGLRIRVVECDYPAIGVDTPADLERVRQLMAQEPEAASYGSG